MTIVATILLALGAAFSLTPFATPALALGAGIAIALGVGNPWRHITARVSGRLLQASVVGLGFGIPVSALVRAGLAGMGVTALTIAVVFVEPGSPTTNTAGRLEIRAPLDAESFEPASRTS